MMKKDLEIKQENNARHEEEMLNRRDFLVGLRKWSLAVIGGALFSGALAAPEASGGAWVNRWGGGSWGNGGRGSWANRYGGGGWINRR